MDTGNANRDKFINKSPSERESDLCDAFGIDPHAKGPSESISPRAPYLKDDVLAGLFGPVAVALVFLLGVFLRVGYSVRQADPIFGGVLFLCSVGTLLAIIGWSLVCGSSVIERLGPVTVEHIHEVGPDRQTGRRRHAA